MPLTAQGLTDERGEAPGPLMDWLLQIDAAFKAVMGEARHAPD